MNKGQVNILGLFEQPISQAALVQISSYCPKTRPDQQPGRSCCPTCTVLRVNVYSSWRGRLSRIYYYVFIFQSSSWMYIWAPEQTRQDMKALYDFVSRYTWLTPPPPPPPTQLACVRLLPGVAHPSGATRRTPSYCRRRHVVLTVTTRTVDPPQAELMNQCNCISLVQNKTKTEQHYLTEGVLLCFLFCFFQSVCLDIFVLK